MAWRRETGFIKIEQDGTKDYWYVLRTNDWTMDGLAGRGYADRLVTLCPAEDFGTALSHIVEAIVGKGVYDAIEIGFFSRIAEITMGMAPANEGVGGFEFPIAA